MAIFRAFNTFWHDYIRNTHLDKSEEYYENDGEFEVCMGGRPHWVYSTGFRPIGQYYPGERGSGYCFFDCNVPYRSAICGIGRGTVPAHSGEAGTNSSPFQSVVSGLDLRISPGRARKIL